MNPDQYKPAVSTFQLPNVRNERTRMIQWWRVVSAVFIIMLKGLCVDERLRTDSKCFSRVSCSLTARWRENGSCLTLTPYVTVSGPSWRAEDRQEWRKCFEVATHPSTVRDEWSWVRERACSGARWWQIRVWIPHLPCAHRPQTYQSTDRLPPFFGRGKKRWNEAGGLKEERHDRELFQGQHQGWRKGNILIAWALEKKKMW